MLDYNLKGKKYNSTRAADPYIVHLIQAMLKPNNDSTYLDIGCGTGNYSIALSAGGAHFIGVDPSSVMLQEAKKKRSSNEWTLGTAEQIPYRNQMFSGALGFLTIHHWSNLELGFSEIYRTLRPESNFIIFTSTAEQMQNYWLNHYFPEMMNKSTSQMPPEESIINAAVGAGFTLSSTLQYFVKPDLKDLFLYSGKHNPSMYLDDLVRNNISSFASLSNDIETAQALVKLSEDINSQRFQAIKDSFDQTAGDYLILQFSKE
jgi:ubiquinone/menaquinone biosynthesis C-methylase UbiE